MSPLSINSFLRCMHVVCVCYCGTGGDRVEVARASHNMAACLRAKALLIEAQQHSRAAVDMLYVLA